MKYLLQIFLLIMPGVLIAQLRIAVPYPNTLDSKPLNGRLLLILSTDSTQEPRYQIGDHFKTQQVFGLDVTAWKPGETKYFDASVLGYPVASIDSLASRPYWMQIILHKYESFTRSDGHRVLLPMDRGEGQQWNAAPGNLLNAPGWVAVNPRAKKVLLQDLQKEMPAIDPPKDTKYKKHIRIQSQRLSAFWGRPMYIGAHVLLPEGFDEHPNVKYPLAVFHGHFPADFDGFRTTPPDSNLAPDYNARFGISGYNRIVQQEAFQFYKQWTGPNFPRVLAVEIQHPTPFYDDSYAVNSVNNGPYGDAIMYELIPEIEKQFRGIGEGWARFMYGGSTGGWEALAVQIFYPKEFNGCYAACPDPVDFRAYTTINIYEDKNAYYQEGPFRKTLRPGHRNYLGHVEATVQDGNMRELVLGTHGRSGDQWDVWESVYSPVGKDGYPMRIWDRMTGVIDTAVASYWKKHFDLSDILQRNWSKLGPDLQGKIKIYCGDMDNYYLNNAVYLIQQRMEKLQDPPAYGFVDYGDRAEHCWNGDHNNPNYLTRLRYHSMFITKWAEEVKTRSPRGADLSGWRY